MIRAHLLVVMSLQSNSKIILIILTGTLRVTTEEFLFQCYRHSFKINPTATW